MKKENGLTEKQKKFKKEYYKNPFLCEDINTNNVWNHSFLGYDNEHTPPEYLQDYLADFETFDALYLQNKYANLPINWKYCIDVADSVIGRPLVNYIPQYISGTIDFDMAKWNVVCRNIIATNDYKYSKLYSTIILEYGILDNLDITREETVTESYGNQRNELTEVHGTQTESTTNNIGNSTVTSDYGKQTSTGTTQPVTTTTTNPTVKTTTLNKVSTYDSETAYLHDSSEVQTDTNTVLVSTGVQSDEATNEAYTDTVTNSARSDSSNVSRETYTDTTTDTKDGYTNTITRTSREFGDASVRTVADNIKQEREIAYINLLDIIFKDVINVLCDYVIY